LLAFSSTPLLPGCTSHKTRNTEEIQKGGEMWQEGNASKFSLFFLRKPIAKEMRSGKATARRGLHLEQ